MKRQINRGHQIVRFHLSSDYLYSAYSFAQQSLSLEQTNATSADTRRLAHRSYVASSVMGAVAFVEATINEFYSVCAEDPDDYHVKGHPQDSRFRDIGKEVIQKLGSIWLIESFQRNARILEKFQIALRLAGKAELAQGSNPYQDANLVIQLRNLLVHFKPEEKEVAVGKDSKLPPDDLTMKYQGKFVENPLAAKYAIFGGGEADYSFFPEKCLGSGCANWAYRSMLNLSNEFFHRLNTTWYYHWLFDKGLVE